MFFSQKNVQNFVRACTKDTFFDPIVAHFVKIFAVHVNFMSACAKAVRKLAVHLVSMRIGSMLSSLRMLTLRIVSIAF